MDIDENENAWMKNWWLPEETHVSASPSASNTPITSHWATAEACCLISSGIYPYALVATVDLHVLQYNNKYYYFYNQITLHSF